MCGIVGLHLIDPELEADLGDLLTEMLVEMTDRGRDSAGVAIYAEDVPASELKHSLRSDDPAFDWAGLAAEVGAELRTVAASDRSSAAVLVDRPELRARLEAMAPGVRVVSSGHALEVFKDVGLARDVCERTGIPGRPGYQGVGHTRMATESRVTIDHSHPFSPVADLCVVHNGSFSNYFSIKRDLEGSGVEFLTDNDTEVAARLIGYEMAQGHDLSEATKMLMKQLDGFYTLLLATRDQFAVVRDEFGCKPALVAVTDRYVAMASEYRALTGLPGIEKAEVFEPTPTEVYCWTRGEPARP